MEKKFKQVVHMEKPTGQADCPPWLDRAHAIYSLMDEKVTTRNVDDDDIADEPLELSSPMNWKKSSPWSYSLVNLEEDSRSQVQEGTHLSLHHSVSLCPNSHVPTQDSQECQQRVSQKRLECA